jgi:aspartate racemase
MNDQVEERLKRSEWLPLHTRQKDPVASSLNAISPVKTIGIVGGMSWASTMIYYRVINEETIRITQGRRCGSLHVISFDSSEVELLIEQKSWQALANKIGEAARSLVQMGSDIILVASNTAHIVFEYYPASLHRRTMHIADALVDRLTTLRTTQPGFIGTSTTLSNLASGRFVRKLGFAPLVPNPDIWNELDEIIFTRLCRGIVFQKDKKTLEMIVRDMRSRGAQQIILGCTEIGLLFSTDEKERLGLLDAAEIHALVAAQYAAANCAHLKAQ